MIAYEVFEEMDGEPTITVGVFLNEADAQAFAAEHYETRIGMSSECVCEVCEEYAPVHYWKSFGVRVAGWGN